MVFVQYCQITFCVRQCLDGDFKNPSFWIRLRGCDAANITTVLPWLSCPSKNDLPPRWEMNKRNTFWPPFQTLFSLVLDHWYCFTYYYACKPIISGKINMSSLWFDSETRQDTKNNYYKSPVFLTDPVLGQAQKRCNATRKNGDQAV